MGTADAVPGVSGGTIALVIGIYERFLDALGTAVRAPRLLRDPEGRRELGRALRFLMPLGVGLIAGYWLITLLLVGPKDEPGLLRRQETGAFCYAFFFGLVLFSLREPWKRIRNIRGTCWLAAAIGAVLAWWFVGLPHASSEPATWHLIYGGALAVCVMLLPGVSGSLLLLILGQYTTVAGAVHDRDLMRVGAVVLGVAIGVITFVPILRAVLRRFHDVTLAVLTGLMAGSLRALWPWKASYEVKSGQLANTAIGDQVPLVLLFAALGALSVWGLSRIERRIRVSEGKTMTEDAPAT